METGVVELDQMLGGGFLPGDAVMLAGSAGTGKTTLALQYLVSGARQGEPGIYVSFEQLPEQLYRDATNFGWDLRKMEKEDKLRVLSTSPNLLVEESGAEALLEQSVKEINPRRIVIDSLSHLSMFVRDEDLRKEIYRMLMFFKAKALSSLLLWEAPQSAGQSFAISDVGVSFLVDSIVMLKFVEIESSIRTALVVMKMRGSAHDRQLREFEISSKGVKVGPPFLEYEGVTSGQARKVSRSIDEVIGKIDEILVEKTGHDDNVPKVRAKR